MTINSLTSYASHNGMPGFKTFLLVTLLGNIVLGCNIDLFAPFRQILQIANRKKTKKKDPRAIHKMMKNNKGVVDKDHSQLLNVGVQNNCCSSCHLPFDKGKRRPVTDSCGHLKCNTCYSKSCTDCSLCDQMPPLATHSKIVDINQTLQSSPSRPRMKTNGHFTTFMQNRSSPFAGDKEHLTKRTQKRPTTVSVDSHSALADLAKIHRWPMNMVRKIRSLWDVKEDVNTKPTSKNHGPSNNDLYMRLGLLLGDNAGIKGSSGVTSSHLDTGHRSSHSHGSYASISSLASSDANVPGASNNTSPVSTLTGSEADPISESSCSTSSNLGSGLIKRCKEQSLDSVASLTSAGTTESRSIASSSSSGGLVTGGRPFRRQDFARLSDRLPLGKRTAFIRRSDRTNASASNAQAANKGRLYALRAAQIPFKPIFFEVPQTESEPLFIGRQWLFQTIHKTLISNDPQEPNSRGVVISGCPGSGKTALIFQLVDYSNFGRKKGDPLYQELSFNDTFDSMSLSSGFSKSNSSSGNSSMSSSLYQSQFSLNPDLSRQLAGHVVAYHFCQTDNSQTCLVPEFLHNLATQLCQAPQLVAYRELLLDDGKYRELLSLPSCITNPSEAFVKGILEPLHTLRRQGKIPNTTCLLVIDALNEAEFYRPDYGDTIASFVTKHILHFPNWLKLVLTVRTEFLSTTKSLPFQHISLDQTTTNESLQRDLKTYVLHRVRSSNDIQRNITVPHTKGEGSSFSQFASHLVQLSKGCILHIKMVLDLLEKSHLVIKSGSYKVVPVNLFEVYLLMFNLKFNTVLAYEKVIKILQICLASLRPLTSLEIYHSVNAGAVLQPLSWEDFIQRLNALASAQFLVERLDGTFMFSHPSLREWLSRREDTESKKFLCDPKTGNALIALRMSRLQAPLEKEQALTLGHHMLKANLFKGTELPRHCSSRDIQALWLLQSCDDLSSGLACPRNAYGPNIKVSRLLLLAGADPDCHTNYSESVPLLTVAAQLGFAHFVSLLLEFGGDPCACTEEGVSALSLACKNGHLNVAQILLAKGAAINFNDASGWSPLVYASANGHLNIVCQIVESDWPTQDQDGRKLKDAIAFPKAAQQALVAAAQSGHAEVCKYLLDLPDVLVNAADIVSGHSALSAACFAGHLRTCEALIKQGAAVSIVNFHEEPPLICAVSEGHWEIAELMLSQRASIEQRDGGGRTPLMVAAAEGHLGILELLLSKGASVKATDKEGLSSLGWASRKGQLQAVQCLVDHSADVNQADRHGRTPLDLAALNGDPDVIRLLLDRGALMEHVDLSGMRPLDRAIGCCNESAVKCFLFKGAKLGPQTWAMADGKPVMLLLLLNKLQEDGSQLYKKNRLKEAAHRFQYAIKKFPNSSEQGDKGQLFEQLKFHLFLGLGRAKRKLNELEGAKDACNQSIEIRPTAYEGFYVRACVKREMGLDSDALEDATHALNLIPQHLQFRKTIINLKNDLQSSLKKIITPLHGVPEGVEEDLVPNTTFGKFSAFKRLGGSTDTLDQVCGISLDSVSLASQRSFQSKPLSAISRESSVVSDKPPIFNKRGFETAM